MWARAATAGGLAGGGSAGGSELGAPVGVTDALQDIDHHVPDRVPLDDPDVLVQDRVVVGRVPSKRSARALDVQALDDLGQALSVRGVGLGLAEGGEERLGG